MSSETSTARPTETDDTVEEQFRSLMEGLRTTLPGAQVLVAFLLVLPVQAEFSALTTLERATYYFAFATAMCASVLLIAPSAHQRVRSPISGVSRRTERHLAAAVKLSIAGTAMLLIAMVAVAFLVTSLVFATVPAVVAAVILATVGGYTWFLQPIVVFGRQR